MKKNYFLHDFGMNFISSLQEQELILAMFSNQIAKFNKIFKKLAKHALGGI